MTEFTTAPLAAESGMTTKPIDGAVPCPLRVCELDSGASYLQGSRPDRIRAPCMATPSGNRSASLIVAMPRAVPGDLEAG
ncbi:MAG: hypothetical protein GX216_02765 [Methanomicrobiales archaeon]|nr:hypothetical protein [Methanomicrobiales archaeon]